MINKIIEETGVKIDIEDDGSVFIATTDDAAAQKARSIIEGIVRELKVGDVFTGKVARIMSFGAFVEYAPGKDGMIHISKLANGRVDKVEGRGEDRRRTGVQGGGDRRAGPHQPHPQRHPVRRRIHARAPSPRAAMATAAGATAAAVPRGGKA